MKMLWLSEMNKCALRSVKAADADLLLEKKH
jgi:hypothetical protein